MSREPKKAVVGTTRLFKLVSEEGGCNNNNLNDSPQTPPNLKRLLYAVIDDKCDEVAEILKSMPESELNLLLAKPENDIEFIQSQFTYLKYSSESPFTIAYTQGQIEVLREMVPYLQKLDIGLVMGAGGPWKKAEEIMTEQNKLTGSFEFNKLIDAIKAGGEKWVMALREFRETVLPQGPIKLNNYYNIEQLLLAAYRVYIKNIGTFDNIQCDTFCVNVIGFLQSLVPPKVAQVFCQGFYYVVTSGKKISKAAESLKLNDGYELDKVFPFYRPFSGADYGLGYTYYVLGSGDSSHLGGALYSFKTDLRCLERLFEDRKIEFNKLTRCLQYQIHLEQDRCCVIL